MSKRRKVPENLMGTILGEEPGAFGGERSSLEPHGSREAGSSLASPNDEAPILWEEQPERVGITFNLSKQVCTELNRLRLELQSREGIRASNSELVEVALRIAIDDAREKRTGSELVNRLNERSVGQSASVVNSEGQAVRRTVDAAGSIVETIYDKNGQVVDEDLIGNVADLPVEAEYVDEQGRLVSVAKDEIGNIFEQVMDEGFNTLATRLLPGEG